MWNLACATGPVFTRFISDASSTVKLILKKVHGTVDRAAVLIAVIAGLADAVPVCVCDLEGSECRS